MKTTFRILRFDPEKDQRPQYKEYTLEVVPKERVLDVLLRIKDEIDGTLTLRKSCAHGVCGSDAMEINGMNGLACQILMQDLKNPRKVNIRPLRGFKVVKDLVVDMEPFFKKYESIKPYLITKSPPPTRERIQSPEDRLEVDEPSKCILCASCTSSCPSFWANEDYLGPAAMVQAARFILDSRDEGAAERFEVINDRDGAWRCHTIFNCTDCCPREIDVTDCIARVKKAILFHKL